MRKVVCTMACTTVIVGKKATIDGSTINARNVDTFGSYDPQRAIVVPGNDHQIGKYVSNQNGYEFTYPEKAYRYQLVPNVNVKKEGIYGESGFNEKNVAMSATESFFANENVLAYDPLVTKGGIAEDSITVITLPYIDSARGGVEYLGHLIEQDGSAEGNGVIFSDKDEVWYMEILTGHHWVACRIPDDCYAVIANQIAIEDVDFDNHDDYLWSTGIREFVDCHHLNPDSDRFNVRHIFGTNVELDRHYNYPRVWFGQRYFNPEIEQDPIDSDMPMCRKPNRLLKISDVQYVLRSHYDETPYDPYGGGSDRERHLYRPIGLNRTQNSHVLQLRNDVPSDHAAIMWLCLGVPEYTPYFPFYANATDTAPSFNDTKMDWNLDDAYWFYRTVTVLVEGHYDVHQPMAIKYLKAVREMIYGMVEETDQKAETMSGDALTAYLTTRNHEIVEAVHERTLKFMGELVNSGLSLSKLTYKMDPSL